MYKKEFFDFLAIIALYHTAVKYFFLYLRVNYEWTEKMQRVEVFF